MQVTFTGVLMEVPMELAVPLALVPKTDAARLSEVISRQQKTIRGLLADRDDLRTRVERHEALFAQLKTWAEAQGFGAPSFSTA